MHGEGPSTGGGCVITADDSPRIMASFSIYFAVLGRGICIGMLAAAIPVMAESVGVSPAAFGEIFSARGMGYFVGTIGGSALLQWKGFKWSKHAVSCASIIVAGAFTAMFAFTESLQMMLSFAMGQGFGFGFLHVFATVAIMEMWGNRAQPWLQVKPCALGMGGVIGPILVGSYGYKEAFIIAGFVCTSCLGIYGLEYLATRTHKMVRWSTKKLHLRKKTVRAPVSGVQGVIAPTTHHYVTVDVQNNSSSANMASSTNDHDQDIYFSRDMGMVENALSTAVDDLQKQSNFDGGGVGIQQSYQGKGNVNHDGLEGGQGEDDDAQLLSISDVLKSAPSLATALDSNSTPSGGRSTCIRGPNGGESLLEQKAAVQLSENDNQVVLPYATSSMVEKIEIIEEAAAKGSTSSASLDVKLVPRKFLIFTGMFGFFYCSLYYSFSSWVTSYASGTGIATTAVEASYLTSQFFLWVTVGSALSVPMSVLFSTSTLLRFQLFFVTFGSAILMLASTSYSMLSIATGMLGFGLSCIFPLLICVAKDYKFTMYVKVTLWLLCFLSCHVDKVFNLCCIGMLLRLAL